MHVAAEGLQGRKFGVQGKRGSVNMRGNLVSQGGRVLHKLCMWGKAKAHDEGIYCRAVLAWQRRAIIHHTPQLTACCCVACAAEGCVTPAARPSACCLAQALQAAHLASLSAVHA
jgi:hypothetical protein